MLMAVSMKMSVFWEAVPCCLVDADQHFRCASGQCPDDEGITTSNTLDSIYHTT
jgi:hypothetical protein